MSCKHETTMRQKMTHRIIERILDLCHTSFRRRNYSSWESFWRESPYL